MNYICFPWCKSGYDIDSTLQAPGWYSELFTWNQHLASALFVHKNQLKSKSKREAFWPTVVGNLIFGAQKNFIGYSRSLLFVPSVKFPVWMVLQIILEESIRINQRPMCKQEIADIVMKYITGEGEW